MPDQEQPEQQQSGEQSPPAVAGQTDDGRVYVVTPQSMAVERAPEQKADPEAEDGDDGPSITDMVEQPAKVMRIGTMIRQLLDEVKAAPLDDPSREKLRDIHSASVAELKDGLAPELVEELERLVQPFTSDDAPSDAELRIAQAQLVGWLEGLFQGLQTALFAQQMAARAQLEQMRRALPPGSLPGQQQPGPGEQRRSDGMYL